MNIKLIPLLAVIFVAAGAVFALRDTLFSDRTPIKVGHLSYHSGDFAAFGAQFDGAADFTLQLINENPPLNRPFVTIHEDIGTVGEEEAAKRLVREENVEVLLNIAHNYETYRNWLRIQVRNNNGPLLPSVHGGAIDSEIGGVAGEPLFRGSPMDTAQSAAAMYQASESGIENVVIIATALDGMKAQMRTADQVAEELGINVLSKINMPAGKDSFGNVVAELSSLNPDAVIVFSVPEDGGKLVKATADAGLSLTFIGTSEWTAGEFPVVATMDAINQHENVWTIAFTNADSPAWRAYETLWNNSDFAELSDASNSYTMQYYDLLNVTALAIEAAGSTDASEWVQHVQAVSEAPGRRVYTYAEGIEALRNGEQINYSGITGEMDYTNTGVVSGLFGVFEWGSEDSLDRVGTLDDRAVMDLDRSN